MAAYSFSLGPVIWMYIPELVDPKVIPWALVTHWLSSALLVFLFPVVTDNLLGEDPSLVFIFFAVYLLISVPLNHRLMVETKGKT
jgi:hypothetical protein